MPRLPRHTLAAAVLAAVVLPAAAHAVNLVPNDSFESFTGCPAAYSQMFLGAPWDAPTTGTSDYYNACTSGPFSPDVPSNPVGFQNSRTGVGHAGFYALNPSPDYREYIEAPLTSSLIASATYQVKFYVSCADNADTAVDRLGAYLSVGPVGPIGNWNPLSFTPQVESPANTFLTDENDWVLVSGTFVAAGGESHIVIGSFHDDAGTNLLSITGTIPGSYYYIDDVSVELVPPAGDQACCTSDGICTLALAAECLAAGGTPLAATSCTPDPCAPTPTRSRSWGRLKTIYR